jgi:Fic family protein
MKKGLLKISVSLLEAYRAEISFDPQESLREKSKKSIPFDYFQFYTSVSSVYSSKIEGEDVDVDSYFKHKFLNVKYEPDYTKRADDLFAAYAFMETNSLSKENLLKAHEILSQNLLMQSQRGKIRNNPMFVLNEDDRIEYVACAPDIVGRELDDLMQDIDLLMKSDLPIIDIFYFASFMHLVFLKIHPLQDGNGRTARLLEKWFLREKIGPEATMIELEKNYYLNKRLYYDNIRKIGLEYEHLNYANSLDFLLMTVNSLKPR